MALYQSARIFTEPQIEVTLNDEQVVVKVQENVTPIEVAITGNAMTHWGQIQGTLSNQTDLQTALDAKVPYSGATGNVNLGEYGLTSGYLQFDITPTTYTPGVGNMGWNDQEGTIDLLLKGGLVSLPLGQKQVARVVNGTGGNVLRSNYQVVKVTGAQGQRLQVNLAQANNDLNSADTLGLIAENINNNNAGFIITSGLVENIDTTGALQGETWTDGNILYLSGTTAGRLTNVKPQAPTHTVICGFVVYAHQNNGKIFVKVDNGYELDELHNVKIDTGTLSNGQVLKYNSSLQVWENNTDAAGTGTVTSIATSSPITGGTITTSGTIGISQATTSTDGYLSSTDWNTFNNKQNALTNPITGTGTSGQVAYFNGTTSLTASATFAFTPTSQLLVNNAVTASSAIARGTNLTPSLTAAANSDTLVGLDINPTFTNGAFTNVSNIGLRVYGDFRLSNTLGTSTITFRPSTATNQWTFNTRLGADGTGSSGAASIGIWDGTRINGFFGHSGSNTNIGISIGGAQRAAWFATGNLVLADSPTDAGFKLDVNGTTRSQNTLTVSAGGATVTGLSSFTGTTASDGGQLGSELLSASGWTSTGWTGDYATGFTHSTGNTTALTNTLAAVNGTYYQILATVTNRTAGSFTITFGGVTSGSFFGTGQTNPLTISTGTLSVTPTSDFNGTVILSVKVLSQGSALISLRNSLGTITNEIRNDASNTNTFIGLNAGSRSTTSTNNTAYGSNAMSAITSGTQNSAFSTGSLQRLTTGGQNVAIGFNTLTQATIASWNTAIGYNSLSTLTNALANTAIGHESLLSVSTGGGNTAVGTSSLRSCTSENNVAVGQQSLFSITSGYNNTSVGTAAGRYAGAGSTANQTSNTSTYIGYQSRSSASGNTNEIVIGHNVVGLGSNTTVLGNSSTVTTGIYGNLLLGSTVTTGERLQVTGTAKITGASSFGGNITLTFNQNDFTYVEVNNTNAGSSAHSTFRANTSNGKFECGKLSSTFGGYKINASNDSIIYNVTSGDIAILNDFSSGKIKFSAGASSTAQWQIETTGQLTAGNAINIAFGTTTGTKIGTATSQKIGFWNATPIVQPTTAVASATRVGGGGTTLTDTDTFDGYTLAQIVKALRNTGILS
jgi:hypothetical protein